MNKKIISLVLALVMVLGTFTSVFAETTTKTEAKKAEAGEKVEKVVGKDNKIQYIIDKKLVEGYEDGTYGLDKNIKRSEITRLLVLANGNEELAKKLQGSMKIYSDVDTKHWANGVITVGTTVPSDANGIAMLAGYPDGSFKPENDVTYAELAKMLVVLAKKDLTADMVKNAIWASSWMTWAAELGILDDVTIADSNKAANRADAFTMIYNALYKMQEFKRVPANEVRGIVSDLNRSKIVLNQDSKKEYTVNADTVIVNGMNERSQFIPLSNINRLDVYAGSLVRVLFNDKNEVTHIIELGNPAELARNNKDGQVKLNNSVWKGVADHTVETANYKDIVTLDKANQQAKINKEYATIEFNGSRTKANAITFRDVDGKSIVGLDIDSKTEIYVANPYNNIMKQVKDINEALSLIGFHNYNGYKIPNVYAGYDNDRYRSNIKDFDTGRNVAKVIVFNTVTKDEGGAKYRVVETTDTHFNSLVENTDGKRFNINDVLNTAIFPLGYTDGKFDVVERRGNVVETLIDHSDVKEFPIVKVVKVLDDNNVQVIDSHDKEAVLYVGSADIFNAEQFKKLSKGDFLQFKLDTDKKANTVDVLSIFEPSGKIEELFRDSATVTTKVKGIEAGTANGRILEVGDKTVTIDVKFTNFESGFGSGVQIFNYDPALKDNLVKAMNIKLDVTFQAKDYKDRMYTAFNFRANVADQPALADYLAQKEAKKALEDKIAEAEALVKDVKTSKDGKDVAKDKKWATEEAIKAINDAIKTAKDELGKETDKLIKAKTDLETAMDNFKPAAGTKEDAAPTNN